MILLGTGSCILASALFGTGYCFVLKQRVVRYSFYWIAAFIMAGGSAFLYVWHMFLALRFHKGVSVGLGIAESLLAAICLTGLGDAVWMFLPPAWASRLVCTMMSAYTAEQRPVMDCGRNMWVCGAVTAAAFILYVMWGCRWEGAKEND